MNLIANLTIKKKYMVKRDCTTYELFSMLLLKDVNIHVENKI